MSCGHCKDEKYHISLKLTQQQKDDPAFVNRMRIDLPKVLPDRTSEQINAIVDFSLICETSRMAEDLKDKVIDLADRCFELKIPVTVKSMNAWK